MTATRAAIYLRQSLDATGEELGIQRHREDCLKIAAERGWSVVAEMVDNSISSDGIKVRPGYNALVAAYERGDFDAVLCWDLDRLTRVPRELEHWIALAENRGLKLVTANGEADLSTDAGRLFARIKAAVARAEVERKGARQRRAALQRAEMGKPPLGTRPFGYSVKGEQVEDEAATVRKLFERFAAGESLKGLATWLGEEGVPTRRGGPWVASTVQGLLRNPRYAGRSTTTDLVTGSDGKKRRGPRYVVGTGAWSAIVSPELFDQVADRLADPRRVTNRMGTDRRWLGSGLFLCATCDAPVSSWSAQRYRCRSRHVNRSMGQVDEFVLELIRERLARPDLADLLPRVDTVEVKRLDDEVKKLEGRVRRTESDYDNDVIDGRRYRVKMDKLSAELAAARSARARLVAPGAASSVLSADDPVAAFDGASLMIRRGTIEALCTVRLAAGVRGRKTFDPWTLGASRWTDDALTWAEHWAAEGLIPQPA